MSLPVPLAVRVGNRHITREVKSLSFRREAIGGVRSISFGLARPLSDLNGLEPLSQVYVYDTRSAATVAQGRLADTGRTASSDGGQSWDVVAFGPAQHTSDITRPLVYVDRSHDGWWFAFNDNVGAGPEWSSGSTPDDAAPALMSVWGSGTALAGGNSYSAMRYTRPKECGMKVARFRYEHRAPRNDLRIDAVYTLDESYAFGDLGANSAWSTAGAGVTEVVGTNFTNGRNCIDVRTYQNFAAGTIPNDTYWCAVVPTVETIRLNADGTEVTSGYTGVAYAPHIVNDLLGRMLPEFDGAGAYVGTAGTSFEIKQLTYVDGVTAENVLEDLMALEPGFRWTTSPDTTGNGYGFTWDLYPTTVRYEATLDDGGNFPLSSQGLYNEVSVRWTDASRRTRMTTLTGACPVLDDAGLTRRAMIDLGSEVGTEAQAVQAGTAFLDEHAVPKNAGTLTVARPIRDVITGAMVDPWEIEPGELVRVLGVEAYPDAFNASTNDGQGVFRIFAVDYTSEGNVATLALDSDPRETADALVKLLKQRSRR